MAQLLGDWQGAYDYVQYASLAVGIPVAATTGITFV